MEVGPLPLYKRHMRTFSPILVAGLLAWSGPAVADTGNFTLVNETGTAITSVTIRRVGTDQWRPLSYAASPGGRAVVQFSDPDCAFDIRANLAGTDVTWAGVNLCEVKAVILNRNASGAVWADYD